MIHQTRRPCCMSAPKDVTTSCVATVLPSSPLVQVINGLGVTAQLTVAIELEGKSVLTPFHEHHLVPAGIEPVAWSCGAREHPSGCHEEVPSGACFQCANGCAFQLCDACVQITAGCVAVFSLFSDMHAESVSIVTTPLHQHVLAEVNRETEWLCDARTHHHGCLTRTGRALLCSTC